MSKLISSYRIAAGKIHIQTPYCDEVVKTCRKWAGKFTNGEWLVPESRLELVKEQLGSTFDDLVEVEVGAGVRIGWYVIATRRSRDSAANVFAELVAGEIPAYGGSVKNPRVAMSDDCRFRLWVPRDFATARNLTIVNDPKAEIVPPPVITLNESESTPQDADEGTLLREQIGSLERELIAKRARLAWITQHIDGDGSNQYADAMHDNMLAAGM